MPIEFKKNRWVFRDVVRVEEALLEALQKKPTIKVDLAACTHLHTAKSTGADGGQTLHRQLAARP